MKLKLPAFFNRGAASGERKPRSAPQLTSNMKSASLARIRLLLLVSGVALLATMGYFVFQLMSLQIVRAMQQETEITTSMVVARVSSMAGYYGESAGLLAKDPEIAALLKSGSLAERSAREESLRYVFPTAINVRLLPPGLTEVDMQASPPLSYAALAQMRAAEVDATTPPIEVHLFNTPQQHVNIVRRVLDPAGSGVVGHIMLSLSNEVVQDILDGLQKMDGYIELQQDGDRGAPAIIATQGDAAIKSDAAERIVPIPATRWQVAYWPATSSLVFLGRIGAWVMAAFLVCTVLLSALVWLLFRRISNAIRLDEVSLVTLMKDFRDGRVRRDYASGLAELKDTLEFMVQLAAGAQDALQKRGPVLRESDAGTTPEQLGESVAALGKELSKPDRSQAVGSADFSAGAHVGDLVVEEEPSNFDKADVAVEASIFRAYDIRGVVDQTLTVSTVYQIGRAVGSETLQRGRNTVVVGRDGRLSGPALSRALIEGILSTGCHVRDIGCVPTPVLYFATHYLDTQSGVIVTGSHNPPDYNGLKIVIDGETLSGASIQGLRERIETQNFISGQGALDVINILPDYVERIRGDISLARPMRVVVDCGNGVAGGVVPELLLALGCEVTELFCEVDGNFPNHHPDPSKVDNLRDLIATVKSGHADVGLAFDGDGDRLGVVAPDGSIIWPDRVLMLFAMDILDRNPGGQIIYDVKCTRFLDSVIREHGGDPLMWKTGHSFIKAKIKESGALLAGEMSGHIFINERWYGFDDGIYAAARLLEILARDERSSQEIFNALPNSLNTPELNVAMREGEPPVFIHKLLENAHFEDATVSTIDGLRADFADGWGLVRASNTTPVLVLRFEADNDAALQRIMGEFRRVMLQVDSGLKLPF
jgi:phosphomannomutase/phosphoglucomutase